ncbi:MAG: response regulator (plasmid) [Nodularia sp. CChRGM 3473]
MIRVLIIEDLPILRFGLKTTVSQQANMEVCGEVASGKQGLQAIRKSKPNVVILKIDLPDINGIDLIITIKKEFPDIKIVVLTQHSDEGLLKLAFNSGASSYLLQDTEPEILLYAIKMSYEGQCWIDPKLSRSILDIKEEESPLKKGKKFGESLTSSEIKVLKMMAFGFSNEQMAENLHVSIGTIRGYTNSLNLKLGSQNRAHAVFRAISLGYINCKSLFLEVSNNDNWEAV